MQRPGAVRIDVMSPFGLALAVGTQHDMLWAYPPSQQVRYEGAATPAQPGALPRRAGLGGAIWSTSSSACRPRASRPVRPSLSRATPSGVLLRDACRSTAARRSCPVRPAHARPAARRGTPRRRRSRSRVTFTDYQDGFPHGLDVSAPGGGSSARLAYDAVEPQRGARRDRCSRRRPRRGCCRSRRCRRRADAAPRGPRPRAWSSRPTPARRAPSTACPSRSTAATCSGWSASRDAARA